MKIFTPLNTAARNKKYRFQYLHTLAILLIFCGQIAATEPIAKSSKASITPTVAAFKTEMHKIWIADAMWTRNLIFCLIDDLPGADQVEKKLLSVQTSIGNSIKPYYGEQVGNKLTELLVIHVFIFEQVVRAGNDNDTGASEEVVKNWYINADELAIFLYQINPNWEQRIMKELLYMQIKLSAELIEIRYQKEYEGDVLAADKLHNNYLKIAEALADGIVKQFPKRFKTSKA